jgi:GntR family transcriptional regulator
VYGLIEAADGPMRRRLQRSVDGLECRMPTLAEARALQLSAVEVQETIAAADKHQFRDEVAMR